METWYHVGLCSVKIPVILYILSYLTKPCIGTVRIVVKQSTNDLKQISGDQLQWPSEEHRGLEFIYHTTCTYNGVIYPTGIFHLSNCITCVCNGTTGHVKCKYKDCPSVENCVKYEDSELGNSSSASPLCCPKCVEYGCTHNGTTFKAGEKIKQGDCTRCYCPWEAREEGGGAPQCLTIQCNKPRCVDAVKLKGKCCPECLNGSNCFLDKQIISEGERIYKDKCQYCYCKKDLTLSSNQEHRNATCERSFFCL